MTTHVYDYNSDGGFSNYYGGFYGPSGGARFYIEENYVYPINGGQPTYYIDGDYWYDYPSSAVLFYVSGGNVYPQEGGRAKYRLTDD